MPSMFSYYVKHLSFLPGTTFYGGECLAIHGSCPKDDDSFYLYNTISIRAAPSICFGDLFSPCPFMVNCIMSSSSFSFPLMSHHNTPSPA